nr:hypothetical protein HmN_000923000 [Hymenolepis microstoma]
MYPETDLGVYARGVAPFSYPYDVIPYFQPYDVAPPFYPYSVALFYPHRTSTLGVMTTLQPTCRDISSRKHNAGRYSSISMDCRIQAHVEVNCDPLSVVMTDGAPNMDIHDSIRAFATDAEELSRKETAIGQRVKRSTQVKMYEKEFDGGRGPTISTWICRKRASGRGKRAKGLWVCLWTLLA